MGIGVLVTEEGRKLRRKVSSGATQVKMTATEVRKNTKRKGGENETEEVDGEIVGETYTEEETEENKQMWAEDKIKAKDKINEIDDKRDEDKGSDSDILENSIFRITKFV